MESKKIIAAALAATIAASVSPINVMGDNEIENFGLGYSEDDNNDDLMLMSAENIDVRKISETDTSITVSWSGFNTEKAAAYTVVCDGLESEKITDTTYTVVGLTGGCEYSIAVRAYDEAGEIVGVSDAIYAYTDWNIISDVTLTSNKTVADLNVSGNLNLNGYTLTVTGDAYLTSSTLFVNRGKMYVNGNFNMSSTNGNCGYGYLNMSNAEDYICVNGDFLAYSYYASSTLTDGTLEVKGDFTQKYYGYTNNFAPSGNHKVVLSGEGLQTVSFERTESGFNVLELQNYSDEGVVFTTPVSINSLVDNGCNTSFANGERSGWTLEADETIEGDLFLSRGTLDLNGHKLTVTGNLVQSGGTVLANGGELEVQGDYRVQSLSGSTYGNSTGVLNMTKEADTVRVLGSFVMQSTVNHSDKLTAGTLEIGGDLTQNSGANGYNFCTSGTHTIVLNGSEKQSVSIYDNGKNYSRINNLKITNTSSEGIDFARGTYVIGKLYNTESIISNVTNLYICSTTVFADNAWNSDANFSENYTISDDLSIGGTVYLTGGTLKLNGHRLNVDGNFNMSSTNGNYGNGSLNMSNAEDYICVNGDFLAYSYYASSTLTDGTLEVKGDFTQKYYGYTNNFAPSGNHKVILSGRGIQKVNFESEQSMFNILEITKPLETGYVFSRTPLWNELSEKNSDNEPPTAPENLHAERSTSTSIKITWNESEDESGIYCYYVYRDGEKVGSTKNLYYVDTGLKSHSQHMYYVIACDVDGNMSEKSDIIEAATDADEYAPTQPANFTAVVKGNSTIYLSWIASSDNVKVVEYNIYRNGVLIAKTEGTAYTDKNAFAGLYTYYVEAVDNEGNVSTASKKVTVDNEAPTKPILTLSKVGDSYISLEWTCSDNVGVTFYNIYRNNVLVKTVSANSYVDTNISIDSLYTYYVVAYDASENKSEASNEVSVYTGEDSTAPEINSIHTAKNKYAKSVPISVSATDNRAVAAIYVQSSVDNIIWEDFLSIKADGKTSSNVIGNLDLTEYSDGELYLRAYAEDLSGNRSSADDSPVFCITVDNTAPKTPYDLSASTENGSLELKWDTAETDNDIEYFKIYRRENDESDYTLAEDNYRYWNYIDSNIELGTRYYYAVSAVDDVGNESLLSEEVMNCISDDKIKPEVLCVTPVTNSKIGEDPKISISCYDNFKLKEVVVECKSSNSDEWAEVFAKDIDSYGEIVSFTLDTSEFTTGVYQLKVSLTDSALNKSDDYIVDYDYRKCSLSAPILVATGAGWSVDLDWSMTNTEEIAGYYVYRRSASDSKYTLIGSVKDMYMTDKNAEAGQKYYYYIEAVDIRGNKIEGNTVSAVPTDEDNIAPVAYMGEGLYGIENKTVSFDGTGSQDNHYVSSYLWDFGDGVTSNDARPKHSYNKAGIYTVSLTVYDSAGNNNTAETEITIYDKDYKGTKLRIRGSDGNVLSGARIYSEMQDRTINASADSSGCYEYIAKKGSYDVYVYREGYIPQMITINVSDEASEFDVVLPKGEVVVGSLETRPLELNEILALGIDPTNPANQKVCEYIVKLEYNKEKKELRLCTGMSGEIINFKQTTNEKWQVYPKTICNSDGETEAITLFSVHTEMSWLKEFYNVDLTIINMADEHFSLEQCEAALTVPYGLSLAGNSFTSTKKENKDIVACVDAGVIKGGETKTISWILRGDSRGEYNLSADFSCVLTPFMEDISLNFKTKEPLVVYGGSALELSIDLTAFDPQKDYWTAKFILKNVSDKPVYNVNFDFKAYSEFDGIEVTDLILKYPSGLTEHIPPTGKEEFLPVLWTGNESIDLRTLNPGEYITGYYSISDFQQFIERN